MLGVSLLFVGIVLINNGVCAIKGITGMSAAVMDILTGGITLIIGILNIAMGNYYAAGTGLLFSFTYLFVAFMNLCNLNPLPFAYFSSFVAVNAVVFGVVEGVTGSTALGITPDIRWGIIWWAWAVLWGSSFFTDILGIKAVAKFVPWLQIAEGVFTAWIPGVMLLLNVW